MKQLTCVILLITILAHVTWSRSSDVPVTDFTCWLYQFYNLTCAYTLPDGYSQETIGNVTYQNTGFRETCRIAYIGTKRRFQVREKGIMDNFTFQVRLTDVKRNVSTMSQGFRYNPDDALLPDKVSRLRVKNVTSSSFTLSWQPPNDQERYAFRITRFATPKTETKEYTYQTDSLSVSMTDLTTSTQYSLTVQCRVYKQESTQLIGHWSESTVIHVITKDTDAPPRMNSSFQSTINPIQDLQPVTNMEHTEESDFRQRITMAAVVGVSGVVAVVVIVALAYYYRRKLCNGICRSHLIPSDPIGHVQFHPMEERHVNNVPVQSSGSDTL